MNESTSSKPAVKNSIPAVVRQFFLPTCKLIVIAEILNKNKIHSIANFNQSTFIQALINTGGRVCHQFIFRLGREDTSGLFGDC